MKKVFAFLGLFTSIGTLLCCALPVILVTVGLGASFASLTSAFPQIIFLSTHKGYLFLVTGGLLGLSYYFMNRSEDLSCPVDPELGAACTDAKQKTDLLFKVSVAIYLIGFVFSYLLPWILL